MFDLPDIFGNTHINTQHGKTAPRRASSLCLVPEQRKAKSDGREEGRQRNGRVGWPSWAGGAMGWRMEKSRSWSRTNRERRRKRRCRQRRYGFCRTT